MNRFTVQYLDPLTANPPDLGQDVLQLYYYVSGATKEFRGKIGSSVYTIIPQAAGASHNPLTLGVADDGAHSLTNQELVGQDATSTQRGHMTEQQVQALEAGLQGAYDNGQSIDADAGPVALRADAANNHDVLSLKRETSTITADEGLVSGGVEGEAQQRWRAYQDGLFEWGDGINAPDAFLEYGGAQALYLQRKLMLTDVGGVGIEVDGAGFIDFEEVAAPSTPASGYTRVYAKSDGKLYRKDDGGTEAELGGGSVTPASTVTSETTFGISPAVGVGTDYARQDHTHGSPTNPITAHEAAGDPHSVYRLESDNHTHASSGAQAGQLDHGAALTNVTANQHHNENHASRHSQGSADVIDVADLASGAATTGQVPVADGAGGVSWSTPSGGGDDALSFMAMVI